MESGIDIKSRISRFTRFKASIMAICAGLSLMSCSSSPDTLMYPTITAPAQIARNQSSETKVTPEVKAVKYITLTIDADVVAIIEKDGVLQIQEAFKLYVDEYGCPFNVILSNKDFRGIIRESENGIETVLAQTLPGKIGIDIAPTLNNLSIEARYEKLVNAFIHELTHACRLNNSKGLGLEIIDEAVADALGHNLYDSYQSLDYRKGRVGALVYQAMKSWSTPKDLAQMVQRDNSLKFYEMFTGVNNPSEAKRNTINGYFIRAWNGNTTGLWQEIEANRAK